MAAVCAACGTAVRTGTKFKILDCFLVHFECKDVPTSAWAALRETREHVRSLERQLQDERLSASRARVDVEMEARERQRLEVEVRSLRSRQPAGRSEDTRRIVELEGRSRELEATLARYRDANEQLSRGAAPRRTAFEKAEVELARYGLGLAVSRGVWGFAWLMAKGYLENLDESEARFALLELR